MSSWFVSMRVKPFGGLTFVCMGNCKNRIRIVSAATSSHFGRKELPRSVCLSTVAENVATAIDVDDVADLKKRPRWNVTPTLKSMRGIRPIVRLGVGAVVL